MTQHSTPRRLKLVIELRETLLECQWTDAASWGALAGLLVDRAPKLAILPPSSDPASRPSRHGTARHHGRFRGRLLLAGSTPIRLAHPERSAIVYLQHAQADLLEGFDWSAVAGEWEGGGAELVAAKQEFDEMRLSTEAAVTAALGKGRSVKSGPVLQRVERATL